jgi:similar to stage IV sporulation protein
VIDVVKTIPKAEGSYSRFPTNLIASENATIDKVLVLDGKLMIAVGNGVKKGDIIVSGKIDIENPGKTNEKGEKDITTRYTRSMGTIEGTFHREVSFEQKLDGIVKKETGKIIKQRYLHLFSADIPLFFKDKTGNYYSDTTLSCPQINGYEIPVGIKTLELREYDHKPVRYSAKQAEELTMEKIKKYESNFLKGYKILEKKEEKTIEKDSVKIKVNYKLYGNICEEAAFFIKKQ